MTFSIAAVTWATNGGSSIAPTISIGPRTHGAGEARLGSDEDRDQRHAERGGEVQEPGVHADHERGAGDQPRHRVERCLVRHPCTGQRGGDALGRGALVVAAPGQDDLEAAPMQSAAGLDPALLGPALRGLRARMHEHGIRLFGRRLQPGTVEAVIERAARRITERKRREPAIALDRVQIAAHGMADIVEDRSERLLDAVSIVAVARAAGKARDECALEEQALGVDHRIV